MSETEQLKLVRRWIKSTKRRGTATAELARELEELLGWADDE